MTADLIAKERTDLVEVLQNLPIAEWARPTLCDGWGVREVVAHMTMPFRYSTGRFVRELVKSGGNFNRMSDRTARRDGADMSPEELVECLRANVGHPWQPPGGGEVGALSHDVIHGLDITVGLGIERRVPEERMLAVLSGLTSRRVKYFGVDLRGVALRADDLEWSYGSGADVYGAAQDLLLVLCGRRLPGGRLRGEAGARFCR